MNIFSLIAKVLHDCSTGIDGVTYNPVRVIGYSSCTAGVVVFFANSIWMAFTKSTFDYVGFASGFAILTTSLIAVGTAEAVKTKTEPPAVDAPRGDK